MNIDGKIQEILQRSLPVNDNCVPDNQTLSSSRSPAKKDFLLESINIVGNQNIIIATNSMVMVILVLLFCAYLLG